MNGKADFVAAILILLLVGLVLLAATVTLVKSSPAKNSRAVEDAFSRYVTIG